jgi:IclR family transcriptional regulator, pca regulon regulatory protein
MMAKAPGLASDDRPKTATKSHQSSSAGNPKSYVASVAKAFAVLRSFSSDAFELTLSEIAARANLDRGTAFRLIQTLVELGYIKAVPQSRRFRLGVACLDLGSTVLSGEHCAPLPSTAAARTGAFSFRCGAHGHGRLPRASATETRGGARAGSGDQIR